MPDKVTKFIQSLSAKTRKQLKERLVSLKKSPFSARGVKKLHSSEGNIYRLRMGKILVVYRINNAEIEIIDIDYRGNVY